MAILTNPLSVTTRELFERFSRLRMLVVGDVMLDWFIWGNVSRISPEAPVPVVEVRKESRYPGGAANVARNLTPFVRKVDLTGVFGLDQNGLLLRETLDENAIGTTLCVADDSFQTITKTRVVAQHQQVVRIDRERRRPLPVEIADRIIERVAEATPHLDGIVIEDYGKGLVTPRLAQGILATAAEAGLPVTVDPKPGSPVEWRGVHTVKPNRHEAFAVAGIEDTHLGDEIPPLEDEPLLRAGASLREAWRCENVLLTLGEQGMLLFSGEAGPVAIPAKAKEVYDVSGAGDTAIALYTLGITAGLPPVEAAVLSNLASGIVVGKLGTAPIEKEELREAAAREFAAPGETDS